MLALLPTQYLRHVWRTVNDGNEDVKVLALQQWWEWNEPWVEGEPHTGEWRDVDILTLNHETDNPPNKGE